MTLTILSWNVRGGTLPAAAGSVVASLAPDVVALGEVNTGRATAMVASLADLGYRTYVGQPVFGRSLVTATRSHVAVGAAEAPLGPGRWLELTLGRLTIVAAYAPAKSDGVWWRAMADRCCRLANTPAVVIGDLNSAISPLDSSTGSTLINAAAMRRILATGWRDAYRELHGEEVVYSFRDHGGRFRIDYALLSPVASRPIQVGYLSQADEHRFGDVDGARISDHSALVLEVDE